MPELQSHVLPILHYALRPGGYLFLGSSENVSQHADLFEATRPEAPHLPAPRGRRRASTTATSVSPVDAGRAPRPRPAPVAPPLEPSLRRTVEARVAERFAPAHVVVNLDGDVIHYSSRTGKYLEAAPGHPSRQLLAMARKGLRLDLRSALQEAVETRRR